MNNANSVYEAPLTPGLSERSCCAGTQPPRDIPCAAPTEAEIDGLLLCERHAREFEAQARADVLEVAALYMCRWLRFAREELCNGELARHLETTREAVEAETKRAHEALELASGAPRRTRFGAWSVHPRPKEDSTSSTTGPENAVGSRRGRRGSGGRHGGHR